MTHDTTNEIPYGYCHCGCGQKTNIAPQNCTKDRLVKGEPMRYISGHHNRLKTSRPIEDRFWEKVDRRGPDDCWEWTAGKNHSGYGSFVIGSKRDKSQRRIPAHRLSYELYNGPIPSNMEICHTCDNPPCVNPAHLFLGTRQDNIGDMVNKQRHTLGERNPQAKLSSSDIRRIRKLHANGMLHKDIARQYSVTRSAISLIIEGKRWKHVE